MMVLVAATLVLLLVNLLNINILYVELPGQKANAKIDLEGIAESGGRNLSLAAPC